jgi:hypothetical protein
MDFVSRLYFGRDDAESDLAEGLLRDGFLPTAAFEAARTGKKFLIIGRKGAGKSAICMRLMSEPAAYLITPDDAAGNELRRFELQGVNDETAKSYIWRYVFLVQIARHIVAHAKSEHGRTFLPGPVRALRKFLTANGEIDGGSFYDRLLKGVSGLQGSISLEAFGFKLSADAENKAGSEGARAKRQLDVIEKGITDAVDALGCREHPGVLLLVDQIEQIWSNDRDSDDMVIGLLLAAKYLHGTLSGIVRCVLFLRADIYDVLHFADGDKFHGDEFRIDWSDARLCELALTRARVSLGEQLTDEQFWGEVMPEPSAKDYVLRRVLPRPRDIIQFLNAARDVAYGKGEKRISRASLLEAELTFSQWKLQDLAKEYGVTYPYLDRLFLMFQSSAYRVSRPMIARRFAPLRAGLLEQFGGFANVLNPESVADTLYSVGLLGVRRNSSVHYAGINHMGLQPHESVFEIHPCFRAALNATHAAELLIDEEIAVSTREAQVGTHNSQANYFGSDYVVASRPGRSEQLLESVWRAYNRLRARVGRARVSQETMDEIIRRLDEMADMNEGLAGSLVGPSQVAEHTSRAADLIDELAGEVGSTSLQEAFHEEARQLRAEVRGR